RNAPAAGGDVAPACFGARCLGGVGGATTCVAVGAALGCFGAGSPPDVSTAITSVARQAATDVGCCFACGRLPQAAHDTPAPGAARPVRPGRTRAAPDVCRVAPRIIGLCEVPTVSLSLRRSPVPAFS